MKYDTAGDPMTGLKWTKKTTRKITEELSKVGIKVSANTVAKLLKLLGFSLKKNEKEIEISGKKKTPEEKKERDEQFKNIEKLRDEFESNNNPIISIDTKKKELIGNFKNDGARWEVGSGTKVYDHDFPSFGKGKAVPYGIYDTIKNEGLVIIGKSCDTPSFAGDSIEEWIIRSKNVNYPYSKSMLILADSGGSNSARSRVWKYKLQELSNRYQIKIVVAHYPAGCSKWNPIEHRLFSQISKNLEAQPLESFEIIQKYISTTTTKSGLTVKAYINENEYETGETISNKKMESLNITKDEHLPKWNYFLMPQKM